MGTCMPRVNRYILCRLYTVYAVVLRFNGIVGSVVAHYQQHNGIRSYARRLQFLRQHTHFLVEVRHHGRKKSRVAAVAVCIGSQPANSGSSGVGQNGAWQRLGVHMRKERMAFVFV